MTEHDTNQGQVWIRTAPTPGGTYRVTLEIDDDTAQVLGRGWAQIYASAILAAVARAEYDAAVIRQMTAVAGQTAAVALVAQMRADRPPITWPTPLTLDPGVSAATGAAFLHILIKGEIVGQWTIPDAREHALAVLEAVEVADLDGAYLRALRSSCGVDEHQARVVVDGMAEHRQ